MWLKKLKHRKIQFALVGTILFVSALIFSASLSFTMEVNRLGEGYYNREGMPNLVYTSADKEVPEIIREALPDDYLGTIEGVWLTEPLEHGSDKITGFFRLFPMEDYNDALWEVIPKEGDTYSLGPKSGEIWIPKVWADLRGVKVGDMVTVEGGVTLKVGALTNTYLNPSSDTAFLYLFVTPDDFDLFSGLPPAFVTTLHVTGDIEEARAIITLLTEGYSSFFVLDKYDLTAALSFLSIILGGIGIMSAVLIFLVAVFVIRFLLRANLIKEYRSIGIYKSQGFSNLDIRGFYFKCYIFVGGISIILGTLASLPASSALSSLITRYMTSYSDDSAYAFGLIVSFASLFIILIISVYAATRPIKMITPVAALRIGVTSSKEKFKRAIIKNAYSPLSMAINDIGKHKSYSVMVVLILSLSFYLAIFSLTSNITTDKMIENTDAWFSTPRVDIYITGRIDDELIESLESNTAVKKVVVSEDFFSTSVKLDEIYNFNREVTAWCYSDFSVLPYIQGRAPTEKNEVAVAVILLNELGLKVGDHISLSLGNKKDTFLITGASSGLSNNGYWLQIPAASLPAYGVEFIPGILMVVLNDGESSERLINYIEDEHHGVQAAVDLDFAVDTAKGVQQMVSPVMLVLIVMFIMFSILCITNLILQNHADNRRQYGIMKALGFSTGYITARSVWRIFLLFLVAAILSIALHLAFSRSLFTGLIRVDAMLLSIPEVFLLLLCLLALIITLTLIFCLPIRKITPQELIEE